LWIHVQDFEVEAAVATGLLNERSALGRIAYATEGRILRMGDIVSSISPQMCAKLRAKGFAEDAVYQLRNWSNAGFAGTGTDSSAYRSEWGLGDRKVALYSGNIANKQGLEIVIEAARMLKERQDLAFVICGEGPNRDRLRALAAGLDNVQFHDLQPVERMGEFLSLASIHLLPQIVGAADLVLPSKLTNMLASGRPVVATAAPGTGLHDEVEGCGINTTPGDPAGLAEGIRTLLDDPGLSSRLGCAARERARERWSQDAIIDAVEARMIRTAEAARRS
jgi:colanic acid biosynthesis glycosyl transferase WcaI